MWGSVEESKKDFKPIKWIQYNSIQLGGKEENLLCDSYDNLIIVVVVMCFLQNNGMRSQPLKSSCNSLGHRLLSALPVRVRLQNNLVFMWSHILRIVHMILLWTVRSFLENFMKIFSILLSWNGAEPFMQQFACYKLLGIITLHIVHQFIFFFFFSKKK
jgi:hypothetical protein